jgi:hypothetical protein
MMHSHQVAWLELGRFGLPVSESTTDLNLFGFHIFALESRLNHLLVAGFDVSLPMQVVTFGEVADVVLES